MSWDVVWSWMKAAEALCLGFGRMAGWISTELLCRGTLTYWQPTTLLLQEDWGEGKRRGGEEGRKLGTRESGEIREINEERNLEPGNE